MHRWTLCLWIGAALGAGALFATGEAQEAPEWKAGLAQVKITPDKPIFMSGYGNRNKPFERVEADLWAKALVLEDREGRRAALVTTDLLGLPASVAEPICERIGRTTGLKREQILLNSAHTHTGPMVSLERAEREGLPAAEAARVADYTEQLPARARCGQKRPGRG